MGYEIINTQEWLQILGKLQNKLDTYYVDRVMQKAKQDDILEIKKAAGQYSGFREAIEYMREIGKE